MSVFYRFLRSLWSIVLLLSFLSAYGQSTASEQVATFQLQAPQLDTLKQIWIYLPKDYHVSRKRYPVLYMHDAQNLFDKSTSYAGEWGIDEYLDSIQAQIIVVGIEHGNEKRIAELTPWLHPKYQGGAGDQYLDFIVHTVKPYVDTTYRVKKRRKHTAIGGSSLGGLISFYALDYYSAIFSKGIIFSPSFWWSEQIFQTAKQLNPKKSRIYMVTGDQEGAEMTTNHQEMEKLLRNHGFDNTSLFSEIVENQGHNEAFWRTAFPGAFEWLDL